MNEKIEIVFFDKKNIKSGISICHKHNLYIIGWTMQRWLSKNYNDLFPNDKIHSLFILYRNNIPIASFMSMRKKGYNIGVYVRKQWRNRGYGTFLINSFVKKYPKFKIKWKEGIKGSDDFFYNYSYFYNINMQPEITKI